MNPEAYASLDRLDRVHWFYRGKRAIVRRWIDRYARLGPDDLLIDAGMGTGTWLVEMSARCRVLGLDGYQESLDLARPRLEAVGGRVLKTSLERVALPDGCAAVVTLLDVLEHLDDDRAALGEMVRMTRPGGLIVVTVPAQRRLWSDWDVLMHHRRRYQRGDLLALLDPAEVELLHCAYFNTLMLPPIWLVRAWRRWFPPRPGAPRAEDAIPPRPLNALLYHAMVAPACWGWFRPPAGVSLLAVLRRRARPAGRLRVDRPSAAERRDREAASVERAGGSG
jgi:ubiquinone/menaquinone biosynthesis C-methylase UbiE